MSLLELLRFQLRGQGRELPVRRSNGLAKPGYLGWYQISRDWPIDDDDGRGQNPRLADCDALRRCDPSERSGHDGSRLFSENRERADAPSAAGLRAPARPIAAERAPGESGDPGR